jgi:protein-tyrosine phosphatase
VDGVDPQPEPFRILVMCTANVCRSPLAAHVLRHGVSREDETGETGRTATVEVSSAGIDVEPGEPMCAQSAARAGVDRGTHAATPLTAELLRAADLVLALDRTHRAAAARMAPDCRPRMFTLRQAAELAAPIALEVSQGQIPDGAPPLPTDPQERLRWLVGELDAARGALAGRPDGWEDIPDDHGARDHGATLDDVTRTAASLAATLADLARD